MDVVCQEKLSKNRQGHQLRCAKNRLPLQYCGGFFWLKWPSFWLFFGITNTDFILKDS
jgi:hypothetical protein